MPFSNEEILGFLKESVGEENLIQVTEPDGILTIEVEKSKLILMVGLLMVGSKLGFCLMVGSKVGTVPLIDSFGLSGRVGIVDSSMSRSTFGST